MNERLLLAGDVHAHGCDYQHRVTPSAQEFQPVGRCGGRQLQESHACRVGAAVPFSQGEQWVGIALAMPGIERHQEAVHAVDVSVGAVVQVGLQGHVLEFIGPVAGNDHRLATAADAVIDSGGHPSLGTQGVISRAVLPGDIGMALPLRDIVHEFAGHGHLELRLLAERDTDGVAQALGQQGTDAHSALDAPILAKSRLGHAQVEREVHVLAVHGVHQSPHGLDHHDNVRRLHRDHHV